MYLVDSNIFVEYFLGQEKAAEVEIFFEEISPELLSITEFALYSIGVILERNEMNDYFGEFVQEEIVDGKLHLIRITPQDMKKVIKVMNTFHLDFDDAYQYVAAEKYDLQILSFDSDFDKTERGRITPQQVLDRLKKQQ